MADPTAYLSLAEHGIWGGGSTPHCYRVLVPLLARCLPFELEKNFLFLSCSAVALTCIILYNYLKQFGCSRRASIVGVLFFLQLHAVVDCFTDPVETDSWGWLATLAALWFFQNGRVILFSIVVAAGVLARESVLFVLGVYYMQEWRRPIRCITVTLLPLFIFFWVRAVVPGPDFFQFYVGEIMRLWQRRTSPEWWHVLPFNIYNSFGPLWILACLRARDETEFLKKHSLFIVFVVGQLVFASDEMRLLTLLFPVVLVLCARAVDGIISLRGHS